VRETFARKVRRLRLLLMSAYGSAALALLGYLLAPPLVLLALLLVVGTSMAFYITAGRDWRCPFCDHRYHPRSTFLMLRNPTFCHRCGEALLPTFPPPPPDRQEVQVQFAQRVRTHRLLLGLMLFGIVLAFLAIGWGTRGLTQTANMGVMAGIALVLLAPLLDLWNWRCPHCTRYLTDHPLTTPRFCPFCGIHLISADTEAPRG